jgi:hypothetical protein
MGTTPAEAVQVMIGMAKDRPDPKAVINWLTAYLGKRPADAKREALAAMEKEINNKLSQAAETRAATLVLKSVQRVRETVR